MAGLWTEYRSEGSNPTDRDTLVKERGTWLVAERRLYVDWAETRELHTS